MASTNAAVARGTVSTRPNASRKLLSAKAVKLAATALPQAEPLEASFPATEQSAVSVDGPTAGQTGVAGKDASPTSAVTALADTQPASLPLAPEDDARAPAAAAGVPAPTSVLAWSEADESALQGMLARRKAAGYQRRGRDVGGQLLRVGDIAPNPGTVAATIVGLVAERGTIARSALLDAMTVATFPHAKAKPADRGWCQGYVAGAVRDGFLALVGPEPLAAASDNAAGTGE